MTIDMPKTMEPMIPDLPPGVPRDAEVQGDPGGREGGGGGRRKMRAGTEGGPRTLERRRMGAGRDTERRRKVGGRDTAEEPIVWRKNSDGIWRRSSAQDQTDVYEEMRNGKGVVWRPGESCDVDGTTINTIVSIQDPNNIHQRLYFPSEGAGIRGKIPINLDLHCLTLMNAYL